MSHAVKEQQKQTKELAFVGTFCQFYEFANYDEGHAKKVGNACSRN